MNYDVVIAGGSVSALLAAREIAAKGLSVLVVEEDTEIGTPEHCGGMVSISGVRNLGIIPTSNVLQNSVKKAEIFSPSGSSFVLNAEKQGVIAIDRRAFDKQIAYQAMRSGAEIWVKCSVKSFKENDDHVSVETTNGNIDCKIMIDARGVASIITKNRDGVLISAQYEVYADWIMKDVVEVYFDQKQYPGFFSWIIPTGNGTGKVGAAGKGINAANALQSFLDGKGKHAIIRKIFAPIWVLGPLEHFMTKRIVTIGDAAGQTKPTTAGGIYTCGMAGILAGRSIANAILGSDKRLDYKPRWASIFGEEFEKMLLARRLFERLDNRAIGELFAAVPPEKLQEASLTGDFDFHSAALSKVLSVKSAARMAKALIGNEI